MMRARNIKPGFFCNEDLAEMPAEGRLLFIGLWCLADREGKLEDRPKRIKGELFRFDDIPVERLDSLLGQLSSLGLIIRYEVNGSRYIKIPNFLKHQRPHVNETPSNIPEPVVATKVARSSYQGSKCEQPGDEALGSDSLNPDSLNMESGILIPDSLKTDSLIPDSNTLSPPPGGVDAPGSSNSKITVQQLAALYNEMRPPELSAVNIPFKRPTKDLEKIKDALKRNPDKEWWVRVMQKVHNTPFLRGHSKRGWKANIDFVATHSEVIMDGKYDEGKGRVQAGLVDWFVEGEMPPGPAPVTDPDWGGPQE